MTAGAAEPESARPPAALDTSVAHPARVYDYWLGGKDNFAADREAAEAAIAANPFIVPGVRITNNIERRAAEQMASKGISINPIDGPENLSRSDARGRAGPDRGVRRASWWAAAQ